MKLWEVGESTESALVSLVTIEGALEQGISVSGRHLMSKHLQLYQHSVFSSLGAAVKKVLWTTNVYPAFHQHEGEW